MEFLRRLENLRQNTVNAEANGDVSVNKTEHEIPYIRTELAKKFGAGQITLIVDANGGYTDPAHARHIAALLRENGYEWFEEPVCCMLELGSGLSGDVLHRYRFGTTMGPKL